MLWIAVRDLLIIYRDQRTLILLFVMPLLVILILGLALGPLWRAGSQSPTIELGVVDLDKGPLARIVIDRVLKGGELGDSLKLQMLSSIEFGLKEVGVGHLTAVLLIPAGFSQKVVAGERVELRIFGDHTQPIKLGIIKSVLTRFSYEASSRQVMAFVALDPISTSTELSISLPTLIDVHRSYETARLLAQIESALSRRTLEIKHEKMNPLPVVPRITDYYSAGIAVMYLLFTVNLSSASFWQERRQGTWNRLRSLPVSQVSLLLGKMASIYITGLIQMLIIIVLTAIFFKVRWSHSYAALVLVVLSTVLAASGLALLIASRVKSVEAADNLGASIILIMSFVGGSLWPLFSMPGWMRYLSRLTLNGWAMEGLYRLMFDHGCVQDILGPAVILVLMGVFFFALAMRQPLWE